MVNKINLNSDYLYSGNINFKSNNKVSNVIQNNESANTLNGIEAISNYNNPLITKILKLNKLQKMRLSDENEMAEIHRIQQKRDLNKDGLLTIEETLSDNVTKKLYPDLHEKDAASLKKYAMLDGVKYVSDEEFVLWLDGDEHGEVLDEYYVRQAEKIRKKRKDK